MSDRQASVVSDPYGTAADQAGGVHPYPQGDDASSGGGPPRPSTASSMSALAWRHLAREDSLPGYEAFRVLADTSLGHGDQN